MGWRKKLLLSFLVGAALSGGAAILFAKPLGEKLAAQIAPRIQAFASQSLGSQVRFDSFGTEWRGLTPRVVFRKIELANPQAPEQKLTIDELSFVIDLWLSIATRDPKLKRASLAGVRAILEQTPNGWNARGVLPQKPPAETSVSRELPSFLAPRFEIELARIDLTLLRLGAKPIELQLESLNSDSVIRRDGVQTQLEAHGAKISAPDFYATPKSIDTVSFLAVWNSTAPGMDLKLPTIQVATADATIAGELSYQQEVLSLKAELRRTADIARLRTTIPKGVIPASVNQWLASSVLAGKLTTLEIRLLGNPHLPAFGESLRVSGSFEGIDLLYDEAWPRLTQAAGKIAVEGARVGFELSQAQAMGVALSSAKGEIKNEQLDLTLAARASQEALSRWIWEGPFAKSALDLKKRLELKSGAEFTAQIKLPLESTRPTEAKIRVSGLSTQLLETQDTIEEIETQVTIITPTGQDSVIQTPLKVSWNDTHAKLWNYPLVSQGEFSQLGASAPKISTRLEGTLPWERIKRAIPTETLKQAGITGLPLSGLIPINAQLTQSGALPEAVRTRIEIESSLVGLVVSLPEPLAKEASSAWEGKGLIELAGSRLEQVKWVSKPLEMEYRAGEKRKLHVEINGKQWQWKPWSDWWKSVRVPKADSKTASKKEEAPGDLETEIALRVKEFGFPSNTWHDVDLSIQDRSNEFAGRVEAREARGEVTLIKPFEKGLLKAHFDRLYLEKLPRTEGADQAANSADTEDDTNEPRKPWEWANYPELRVFVEDLRLGEDRLGVLKFSTRKNDERVLLQEASLRSRQMELTLAQGEQKLGLASKSEWKGKLTFHDFDRKLKGYRAVESIHIPEGAIDFNFRWPGTWDQFGWAKLQGQIQGKIPRGTLQGVKGGALAIIKLFQLKIFDLGSQVLRFHAMDLNFKFDRGALETSKSKCFLGSTFVKVAGKTHMISERLEFNFTVTPIVGSLLNLFKGEDDEEESEDDQRLYQTEPETNLTREYQIRGTWDSPRQD